jgi:hypothetical protein
VQDRFINFAKKYDPIQIIFIDDLLIINHQYNTFVNKYTNLFKKFSIDPRDEERIIGSLIDMVNLPT